jgi:galactokinase
VAPGRVNLIGEHTDYNDGFVLPMALPMVTVVVGGRKYEGSECSVITLCDSCDLPKKVEFNCDQLQPDMEKRPKWAEYVKGVVANFHQKLENLGFNAVISSSVPLGKRF